MALSKSEDFKLINFISDSRLAESLESIHAKVNSTFNMDLSIRVKFNPRMRSVIGRAWHKRKLIELNQRLCSKHPEEIIPTLIHELAHIIARELYGSKIKSHGLEWSYTMRRLGHEPTRCHNLDTSGLKRTFKKCPVQCQCRTMLITKRKLNRIIEGLLTIYCRKCTKAFQITTDNLIVSKLTNELGALK